MYPLDTLKTRIQSPDYSRVYKRSSGAVNRSLLFRGLYQGLGSVIIATLPASGAFFTTYEGAKSFLHAHGPHRPNGSPYVPTPLVHAAASSLAELVSCLILTPAEVIKQNAQMVQQAASSSSSSATAQALRRFQRPSQLWRGYTALAARNLPFTAMQFPLFEHLKAWLLAHRDRSGARSRTIAEHAGVTALSAGGAGAVAAVLTTPVDVVKTRIMLAAAAATGRSGPASPHVLAADTSAQKTGRPSSWSVGREVWRSDGMRGLWRGGALRGAWTALGSGLYLSVYESGREMLGRRRARLNEGSRIA